MNALDHLFTQRKKDILNIYTTAGFPSLESTGDVMLALQESGTDIIELGIPYSDPVADGTVIQQSNMTALQNGVSLEKIFAQLAAIKEQLRVPVVLMGYINPVMQYGMERFCEQAASCGVAGVILPDLPMYEYEKYYAATFKKNGLKCIFLISPSTGRERMKKADRLSGGFLYAVSSSSTTGSSNNTEDKLAYYRELVAVNFRNPVLIGFGIRDKKGFDEASRYAAGAIIGSAFIDHIAKAADVKSAVKEFVAKIRGRE
ncbi:MAG: tryptophan synthase subunit alpha [Ferruginibacter sp.]